MAAVDRLVTDVDAAAQRSVSQAAYAEKKLIRAGMTGPPRWLHGQNAPRSGGPGQVTGRLMRSVSYSPVQKAGSGRYTTRIAAKRVYANRTESRYPYFVPGHREAGRQQQQIFEREYTAAIH